MTVLGKYSQTPTENKLYTVDLSQWLATAETAQSVTYAVTPVTSPAFAISGSAIAMDGKSLSFYASGGLDGKTYKVVVHITTSLAQQKEYDVFFAVKNI
jgi:hypothetical protein